MAALEFQHVSKSFGAVHAAAGRVVQRRPGQRPRHRRRERRRKIDAAQGARRHRAARPRRGLLGWRPLGLGSPRDALEHGIGMVYQEMLCFPNLSVTANIFAGREVTAARTAAQRRDARADAGLLHELHLAVSPLTRQSNRSRRRIVSLLQVARALAFDCRILVLDEPTTVADRRRGRPSLRRPAGRRDDGA